MVVLVLVFFSVLFRYVNGYFINSKSHILRQVLYWIKINHKWLKKLVEIRIAKQSKFVVKLLITPELCNPLIYGVAVSSSTFGVIDDVAAVSNVVVISNVVVVIVVVVVV